MEEVWDNYNRVMGVFVSTVEALIKALDTRDIVSSGHSLRVADSSCAVGDIMGFSEKGLRDLKLGGLLHDVGKIGISEVILGKPGRLTDQEYFLVKKHPEIGEEIVEAVKIVLKHQFSTPLEDLVVQTARVLGIRALHSPGANRIGRIIRTLLKKGVLKGGAGSGISLAESA